MQFYDHPTSNGGQLYSELYFHLLYVEFIGLFKSPVSFHVHEFHSICSFQISILFTSTVATCQQIYTSLTNLHAKPQQTVITTPGFLLPMSTSYMQLQSTSLPIPF